MATETNAGQQSSESDLLNEDYFSETDAMFTDFSDNQDVATEQANLVKTVKDAPPPATTTKETTTTKKAGEEPPEDENAEDENVDFNFDDGEDRKVEKVVDKETKTDTKTDTTTKKEGEGDSTQDDDDDKTFFKNLIEGMKENSIFTTLKDEDFEGVESDDQFFELQQKEIENRVDEQMEQFVDGLDEEAKAFLKFKRQGGSTQDFVNTFGAAALDADLNPDTDDDAKKIIVYHAKNILKMDDDDANDQYEFLKEKGKAKESAKKYKTQITASQEAEHAELIQQQEAAVEQRKAASQKLVTDIGEVLKGNEIRGFKLTNEDKKDLGGYISRPTAKVGNRMVTGLQRDLQQLMSTPEGITLIAKMVKNGFSADKFEENAETKVTKQIKNKLNDKANRQVRNTQTTNKAAALWDKID